MQHYNIAMMGDSMTCLSFRALGIETEIVEQNFDEARNKLREWIHSEKYGILFVTEELSEKMHDILEEATYLYLPSIILIPDVRGSQGLAASIVRNTLKKAAGRDIMAED
jgi:V/A-type H+-transporting ATPase subunit F